MLEKRVRKFEGKTKTGYLQDGHFLLHDDWLLFDDWNDLVNSLWDWHGDVLVDWVEVRLWNLLS